MSDIMASLVLGFLAGAIVFSFILCVGIGKDRAIRRELRLGAIESRLLALEYPAPGKKP